MSAIIDRSVGAVKVENKKIIFCVGVTFCAWGGFVLKRR